MMENPKNITLATYYIIIARYLERCADHACKMAENVHYMETGERSKSSNFFLELILPSPIDSNFRWKLFTLKTRRKFFLLVCKISVQ